MVSRKGFTLPSHPQVQWHTAAHTSSWKLGDTKDHKPGCGRDYCFLEATPIHYRWRETRKNEGWTMPKEGCTRMEACGTPILTNFLSHGARARVWRLPNVSREPARDHFRRIQSHNLICPSLEAESLRIAAPTDEWREDSRRIYPLRFDRSSSRL